PLLSLLFFLLPIVPSLVLTSFPTRRSSDLRHADRICRLVLVDALELSEFEPDPAFGQALMAFMQSPNERTHDQLWGTVCIRPRRDRKSTRLNSSHVKISYAVFCLKKKKRHK